MQGLTAPVLVHERDLSVIPSDMELALMFAITEYNKHRHEQYKEGTYEFFSKILWPIAFIQAGSEKYIGIDELLLCFDLEFKKTKFLAPNNPLFSTLAMECGDFHSHLDLLTRCIEELNVPLKEKFKIKGILNPEIIHGLVPLIKLATDTPINAVKLEPIISTDELIAITNSYNQILKSIEETISKWHSLQQIIEQKFEKWHSSYAASCSSAEQKQIKEKYDELNKKILDKIWDCRNEIDYLLHWALSGHVLNLVVPITEIWIPMYLAGIILPNNTRKFLLSPPSIISTELKTIRWLPIDSFHSSFNSIFKERVEAILDAQTPRSQKIKSICLTQNLFLKEEANNLIVRGFDRIREKQLIENKHIEIIQQEWQKAVSILKKEKLIS